MIVAEVSVFDDNTHRYDYFAGRVVRHDVATLPFWIARGHMPPTPEWPRENELVYGPFRARDVEEAARIGKAEFPADWRVTITPMTYENENHQGDQNH